MTAALSTPIAPDLDQPFADEPVALLQLSVTGYDWALADAASAVYQEVRRGRRVVAVASGARDAAAQLVRALDAIGVSASSPGNGEAFLTGEASVVAGPEISRPPVQPRYGRPVRRVALAGRGVVGGGLLPRLLADPRFEVVGVLVRDPAHTRRDTQVPPGLMLTDGAALLAREPDVLIEATSDASTGLALIRAALTRGVDVITASKQAIAADLGGLTALAAAGDARLSYSAAVGGGAPVVEAVERARRHGEIAKIEGVLNGTCNFILDCLAVGEPFADALAAARSAGFAEADPSADLSGLDAAAKLSILAFVAGFSLPAGVIDRQELDATVSSSGVRQLAHFHAVSGGGAVFLRDMTQDPLFGDLRGERNAARVTLIDGRFFVAKGRGAGRAPTCESVWADLIDLIETGHCSNSSADALASARRSGRVALHAPA